MKEVKIKKFHPNATIPKQATEFSGGWDVTVTEIIQESNDFVICKLGWGATPPENHKITLVPRSSLTKTKWIVQNSPGLGDEDYINEYQFRFRALPVRVDYRQELIYPEFPYKIGDRIGQIYLEEVIPIKFIEVDELEVTERKGGFGSTNY